MIRRLASASLVALGAFVTTAHAQDFRWSGSVGAGGEVSVGNVTGNVTVIPSNTGRVEVLGIKRGSGSSLNRLRASVEPNGRGLRICVLYDDATSCDDNNGSHSNRNSRDDDWGNGRMDLEVAIPADLEVSAASVSGNVSVTGAQGDVRATTVSGDVRLDKLRATSVHATSVSGGVEVHVDAFTGNGDLDFTSVSGSVTLYVPRNFEADLTMSSVSGDVDSDFALTVGTTRMRRGSVDARIGNGGRRLNVHTVSGNLRLRAVN